MMRTMMLASCLVLAAAAGARAADAEPKEAAPDRAKMAEKHEKMAEMHRKAAECLKGTKTVKECRDEMMKAGPAGWHGEGCEMCEGKMHKHGKGMRAEPAPKGEMPKGESK